MKKSSAAISFSFDAHRANLPKITAIIIALSVALGLLRTNSMDELVAYLLVTLASAVPIAVWIWTGASGIPLLPSLSVIYFIYYAIPILSENSSDLTFEPSEILGGAITVALFLIAATASWWLLLAWNHRRPRGGAPLIISGSQVERVMFFGLASGSFYHIALYMGWFDWLGPAFGLVRSIMLTLATAACFMLGHARAQGSLRGQKWAFAVSAMALMIALSWASLFLVSGLVYCLAAVFAYVLTTKRVPWIFIAAAIAAITVFHAGKDSMRDKYWITGKNYGAAISVAQVPALMAEWAETGLTEITSGSSYRSAIDRASLLNLLMQVQRLTPDYVAPLNGKSYELLLQMLVPRFLDPNKITSQDAMKMLNVDFRFQTAEQTESTAVGWGLIAEAYANFGNLCVIAVGLLYGLLCGSLERWSAGAPLVSLPSLISVVVMMQMVNVELDAAALLTTLFQTIVAVSSFFWLLGSLRQRTPKRVGMRR
jgi:hypothetical protein